MSKKLMIHAVELFDGKTKKKNVTIEISGNTISKISNKTSKADFEGFVTPAFIDAHSHIGMCREGEPSNEEEVNDRTNQILPMLNPLDSVYFDDRAFCDSIDFGQLYSCIVPGSGNIIAGKAMIIKNFAKHRDEALVADYGFKMALGYNPRGTTDWKGERPNSRMGVYALLERHLDTLLIKKEKETIALNEEIEKLEQAVKGKKLNKAKHNQKIAIAKRKYELAFTPDERELLKLLSGEKIAKVHVHKEDDVLYLIHLVKKYNLKVTAEHVCDVFHTEIFNKLADNNIPIVYGPMGSLSYKVELKHAFYQNTKLLMQSRANYGLMSDHPVINAYNLRDSLKFFLIAGMSEEDAISLITYKNAKILGIDKNLGSVEEGKLASIVVWNKNPLHLGARAIAVIGEGMILRS